MESAPSSGIRPNDAFAVECDYSARGKGFDGFFDVVDFELGRDRIAEFLQRFRCQFAQAFEFGFFKLQFVFLL